MTRQRYPAQPLGVGGGGATAYVCTDHRGQTMADISLTAAGAAVAGATLTLDSHGQLPVFYGRPSGGENRLCVFVGGAGPVEVFPDLAFSSPSPSALVDGGSP